MSQSIKLSNNLYWDTSGLYGARILTYAKNLTRAESITITIPNMWRGFIFIFSPGTVTQGILMVCANSGGSINVTEISLASLNTYTTSVNTLVLNTTASATQYVYYLSASSTLPSFE